MTLGSASSTRTLFTALASITLAGCQSATFEGRHMLIRESSSNEVVAQIAWPNGQNCSEVLQSMANGNEISRATAARTTCAAERLIWPHPVRAVFRIGSTATLFELETLLTRHCKQAILAMAGATGNEVIAVGGCRGAL
jgi:hypothetical protein